MAELNEDHKDIMLIHKKAGLLKKVVNQLTSCAMWLNLDRVTFWTATNVLLYLTNIK
jgi:hypothetical protein